MLEPTKTPKLAIIIGVGRGLGGALSKRFAAAGHPVAMVARTTEATQEIRAEIQAAGGRAQGFAADAQDDKAMKNVFDQAEAAFGPVGVAIFSVGGRTPTNFLDLEAADIEQAWRAGCLYDPLRSAE